MTTVEVKLSMPDQVATKAKEAGLLTEQALGQLVEEAVRRESGKRLLEAMQLLKAANVPPLSEEEIAAEVRAVRAARRTHGETGR